LEPSVESPLERVKKWLLARRPEIGDLAPDQDLVESRVIDSLSFLEFVYFLEELTGREIQVTPDTVQSLRTLRSIEQRVIHGDPQ
jgi:acyl carrier protein